MLWTKSFLFIFRTDSYWDEIVNGTFSWQSWRDEAVELRTVTKTDVIEAFDEWLHPEISKRRILVVQVIGGEDGSTVAVGKPTVSPGESSVGEYADKQVEGFHRDVCKRQTWGRVTSKLA